MFLLQAKKRSGITLACHRRPSQLSVSGHGLPLKKGGTSLKSILRRHKSLWVAVALGFSAFIFSYRLMVGFIKTAPVVVAANDVGAYQTLSQSDLKVVELPVRAVPKESFADINSLLGSYPHYGLSQGQIVLEAQVAKTAVEAGYSVALSSDTRGFFIPASLARGLGGLLKKGERVDIICASKATNSGQSYTFPNVRVVEVLRDKNNGEFLGALVVLAPYECQLLASGMETGTVYLSLVPKADWEGLS